MCRAVVIILITRYPEGYIYQDSANSKRPPVSIRYSSSYRFFLHYRSVDAIASKKIRPLVNGKETKEKDI